MTDGGEQRKAAVSELWQFAATAGDGGWPKIEEKAKAIRLSFLEMTDLMSVYGSAALRPQSIPFRAIDVVGDEVAKVEPAEPPIVEARKPEPKTPRANIIAEER